MREKILQKLLSFENRVAFKTAEIVRRDQRVAHLNYRNRTSSEDLISAESSGITVSLTTFGSRISEVYLAIESIGEQTLKPGRLVLWLTKNEYATLPQSLKSLEYRGLEIREYKDIRAYKKLIPSLHAFPNEIIVTIDDDIIYNQEMLETLVTAHKNKNNEITCGNARVMTLNDGTFDSYNSWPRASLDSCSGGVNIFPVGFAGTLYFPGCFHRDILSEEKFITLAPYSDDIWFKCMSLLNGVSCLDVSHMFASVNKIIPIQAKQADSLSMINVVRGENDKQLYRMIKQYPDILRAIENRLD
jgi:hypothetical protein